MEKSILDIIAQSTAKTIEDVSKLYREAYSEEEPQADTTSQPEKTDATPNAESTAENASSPKPQSFRYGTPFVDIVRFTRDVEVFTRHIDAQTRRDFEQGKSEQEPKK